MNDVEWSMILYYVIVRHSIKVCNHTFNKDTLL